MGQKSTGRAVSKDRMESGELARLLLDSTGEAIYGIDTLGRCTFCNSACLRLLGYNDSVDLTGRNMHELMHHTRPDGTAYPNDECRIYLAFRRGECSHVDDEVVWRSDGTSFPVEYWSRPLRENNLLAGAVVTFVDISKRNRALEEIEAGKMAVQAANRAKSKLLSEISYEIRTGMNSIIGMTDLLMDTELNPEQADYLQALKSSAESLLRIIDGLLFQPR